MPVKGGCIATFEHSGKKIKARLLIVDKSVKPILGLQACEKLPQVKWTSRELSENHERNDEKST